MHSCGESSSPPHHNTPHAPVLRAAILLRLIYTCSQAQSTLGDSCCVRMQFEVLRDCMRKNKEAFQEVLPDMEGMSSAPTQGQEQGTPPTTPATVESPTQGQGKQENKHFPPMERGAGAR